MCVIKTAVGYMKQFLSRHLQIYNVKYYKHFTNTLFKLSSHTKLLLHSKSSVYVTLFITTNYNHNKHKNVAPPVGSV